MSGPRPVTPAGLLAARLRRLADDASTPLAGELAELAALASGLEDYPRTVSSPEPPHLAELAALTRAHDWASAGGRERFGLEQEMLSGHLEGRLLALLVRAVGATRVLEIGTFTGYAALAMADALPLGGRVVTCEADVEVAAIAARAFAAHEADIDLRVGPAADTLDQLVAERAEFDLVFLDADKAGYRGYVEQVLAGGLLAPRGLLCVDNTLMQGEPWLGARGGNDTGPSTGNDTGPSTGNDTGPSTGNDTGPSTGNDTGPSTGNGRAIAEFNEWLAADTRVQQVVVPLRDGVTLAVRGRS